MMLAGTTTTTRLTCMTWFTAMKNSMVTSTSIITVCNKSHGLCHHDLSLYFSLRGCSVFFFVSTIRITYDLHSTTSCEIMTVKAAESNCQSQTLPTGLKVVAGRAGCAFTKQNLSELRPLIEILSEEADVRRESQDLAQNPDGMTCLLEFRESSRPT
ncbi:hypothetical protein RvY_17363-1 [Ramazzottius varieornatus]|uniref:Uncharacterized protein n=1 Tax=Ramazzottius varieornatus TaxID=947166 RepID=A0A1D1W5S7_RAMVA|nr:hypothetical protein RvY_17363-1 [Ramazzottius varieornatus]